MPTKTPNTENSTKTDPSMLDPKENQAKKAKEEETSWE